MDKKILYTIAIDPKRQLVIAPIAEKGTTYHCPVCSGLMILRKSGNTRKGSKRPHFAHKSLTPNCTPESVLHYGFKMLLANKIQTLISERAPLSFEWDCSECGELHAGNLLKKIHKAEIEYNLGFARPDIALLSESGRPHAVIEVVVSHAPEPVVAQFYKDNEIILIQIKIHSEGDIEQIDRKIAHPDLVNACFHPTCPKCHHYFHKARLQIVDGNCWKCELPMKVAFVKAGDMRIQVPEFESEWLKIASDNGVLIKEQYSKTIRESYLANTCKSCNAFVGDHFLFTDYCSPAEYGDLNSNSIDLGYKCIFCEEQNSLQEDLFGA